MARRVDLNVDIGEGFPHDEALLEIATSANICCGVHAGSAELTRHTIDLCRSRRVRFGAHPGYPDRASMGRSPIATGQERLYLQSIFDQVMDFAQIARAEYIKPHGAFYNDTAVLLPEGWDRAEPDQTRYQAGGIYLAKHPGISSLSMLLRVHRLPLVGMPRTAHAVIAMRAQQHLIREGFADRAYLENGQLVPRTAPGAVLKDPAAISAQVLNLAPKVDTICLHGDNPNCVEFARLVRATLENAGYEVGF